MREDMVRSEQVLPPTDDTGGGSDWRPIETAPTRQLFDVWRDVEGRIPDCELDQHGRVVRKHSWPVVTTILIPTPTHWMPRPAPPRTDERSETVHGTARLPNSESREQVIAELCEALDRSANAFEKLLRAWMYAPFPVEAQVLGSMSPPTGPFAEASDAIVKAKATVAKFKARGAAG